VPADVPYLGWFARLLSEFLGSGSRRAITFGSGLRIWHFVYIRDRCCGELQSCIVAALGFAQGPHVFRKVPSLHVELRRQVCQGQL